MLHARYWKQIFSEVQTISFFPVQWKRIFLTKPLFQLLEEGFLFFKKFFISASGNTFFSPEEKILFFSQNFFSCQWKSLFKLQRSLLKTLITLLGIIFFDFSDISANASSFFVQQKRILKQILFILASGNQFSVYLKQYSFIWTFFFCQWKFNL